MSAVRPIKPSEVANKKLINFPDAVFEAFNQLIAQNFSGGSAVVKQKDVVALVVGRGIEAEAIYKNHWLDVEDVYRAAGWRVMYDKPAYCEDWYDPYFKFSKK